MVMRITLGFAARGFEALVREALVREAPVCGVVFGEVAPAELD
jgi:hypothetical protein